MKNIILLTLAAIGFSSCANIRLSGEEYIHAKQQKTDINEYIYLETSTGIYNSSKAAQDQLIKKQTAAAVKKLNAAKETEYHDSSEEDIERASSAFIAQGKWKAAFDVLTKYEPVLTHNKNLTNQIVYVALKMEYYDYAIDQIQLALNQYDEMRALNQTRMDKEIILAHVYYLSHKYDRATALYTKLLQKDNYAEAAKYLFLIGYKLNDLDSMRTYLTYMGADHADTIEFNILTAKVELSKGLVSAARQRLEVQFELHPDNQELVFEYVNALIEDQEYKEALSVLDHKDVRVSDTRQYHFMKSFIYHQSGDKKLFHRELASTQVEERYDKLLTNLFLEKHNYAETYATIFQKKEMEEFKLTHLVKEAAEQFTYQYINKAQFKDAILVREEFHSVTEPIRLPASLEFKPPQ